MPDPTLRDLLTTTDMLRQALGVLIEMENVNHQTTQKLITDLRDWLEEPPRNDLSAVVAELVAAVSAMRQEIAAMPERFAHAVAAAVKA